VHFGSRGLGHSTATKYLKLAGGKDGYKRYGLTRAEMSGKRHAT
jgi:RNA-splicing ligase RtcB